ncbi:hypothetical protein J1N35_028811 [Gossypium stocksii]|uniref:Uncharacterized protein n=1 Tax=Gossypium stocksii TaxID=47602 RepID=A0A9D3UXM5_9ROSI|nr:hypothetical protein J1N35_028811 [Gossypium stocksii]
MLPWDQMCYPKGMGGLGFRELRLFNVALLGRQVWRLINYRDTLYYKVLSVKYFSDGDVFNPKSMDKPSFMWQSIAKAAKVLYEGFGWMVGNEKSIKLWHDNWGFEGLSSNSICLDIMMVKKENVCDFFNKSNDGYDKKRVLDIYGENLRDQICNIPILHNSPEDRHTWFYNPHDWAIIFCPRAKKYPVFVAVLTIPARDVAKLRKCLFT